MAAAKIRIVPIAEMKNRLLLLAAVAFLGSAGCLRAQFVWAGNSSVDGSVSDPTNWQPHTPAVPVGDGSENFVFGDITGTQWNPLLPTMAVNNLTFTGANPPP